ncbi:hypothetical protein NUM_07710 [Actinocatenispora comari]|uniref:Uncharacterized protein n=1 Tax=Actinocatenispora comari TaxID=2807577 RepID=A0A8J4A5Z6_9ACTN|nr:hypothetical protein NUM_07710 [Actinocatenispora comari]
MHLIGRGVVPVDAQQLRLEDRLLDALSQQLQQGLGHHPEPAAAKLLSSHAVQPSRESRVQVTSVNEPRNGAAAVMGGSRR